MRRVPTFLLAGVFAVGLSFVGPRVPEALASIERFRIENVEIEGLGYLDRAEAVATLALPADASVWDDPTPWTARLASHPMVRTVRVSRRLPSTLVVRVEERTPVALLASPTLQPVDGEGRVLPLDPSVHYLDLPLLRVPPAPVGAAATRSWPDAVGGSAVDQGPGAGAGAPDTPSRPVRVLAGEAARLAEADPAFGAEVSELEWMRRNVVTLRWGNPAVTVHFRAPLAPRRVREVMAVIADARSRSPGRTLRSVDLRYADQVVVRYEDGGNS